MLLKRPGFTVLCLAGTLFLTFVTRANTPVDVVQPEVAQQQVQLQLTGTIESTQQAALAPLQAGRVEQILVEVGDAVAEGQKLLVLDDTLARLQLAQNQASVDAAKVDKHEAERLYQEVIALSKQQLVAETLIGERRAALANAKAALTRQQASLALQQEVVARHTLFAPFAGVIAERQVNLGEWVSQQSALFTLVQDKQLRLKLHIPQEYLPRLRAEDTIAVQVLPDYPAAQAFAAQINRLVKVSDLQSRTLTAYVDLPDDPALVVGMPAQASLSLAASQQTMLWLPKSALKQHPDGGASVFAVVNGKAKRYLVTQVKQQGKRVAVTGAPANYAYVSGGVALLADGAAVTARKQVAAQ